MTPDLLAEYIFKSAGAVVAIAALVIVNLWLFGAFDKRKP